MKLVRVILNKNLLYLKRNMISFQLKAFFPLTCLLIYYIIVKCYDTSIPAPEKNYLSSIERIAYSSNISDSYNKNNIFAKSLILVGCDYHNNNLEQMFYKNTDCKW